MVIRFTQLILKINLNVEKDELLDHRTISWLTSIRSSLDSPLPLLEDVSMKMIDDCTSCLSTLYNIL